MPPGLTSLEFPTLNVGRERSRESLFDQCQTDPADAHMLSFVGEGYPEKFQVRA
jgi:hypothetical protein